MENIQEKTLIHIIENSNDEEQRYNSLKALQYDFISTKRGFALLENLLISDLNPRIRKKVAEILAKYHFPKAVPPLKWVIKNDISLKCVLNYLDILKNYDKSFLIVFLIDEIKRYFKKYKKFQSELSNFKPSNRDLDDLIYIFLNYKVLDNLIRKFPNLSKEIENIKIHDCKIKKLILKNFKIKNIKNIEGLDLLRHLEDLNLSFNHIHEIDGLNGLLKLRNLNLSHNKIKKIKNLEYLTELISIELGFNEIEEIEGLMNQKKLKNLNLMHNKIREFKGLTRLLSLEDFNLSKNLISEIKDLDNFLTLKHLDLTLNNIQEISNYEKYKNKFVLELYGNPFKDYYPPL